MQLETRRYAVHPAHHGRDATHTVEGVSYEDAALAFVDRWHPPADESGEVTLLVADCETGRQVCLRVDLDEGSTAACD
ncbi:MAG TPA: DUF5961 family protein [Caulobacter sp.]|nr:DUF5961 family protein [Caulobacter sp.]